jgi:hypothetical protein
MDKSPKKRYTKAPGKKALPKSDFIKVLYSMMKPNLVPWYFCGKWKYQVTAIFSSTTRKIIVHLYVLPYMYANHGRNGGAKPCWLKNPIFVVLSKTVRRLFNILLMLLVLLQTGGVLLIYGYRQYQVKREMRTQILAAQEGLEKIILSTEAYLKARVDRHEIMLEGRMYDVHSMAVTERGVEILALHDEKETAVINDMLGFFGFAHHKESPVPQKILTLMGLEYTLPEAVDFSPVLYPVHTNFFQSAETFVSFDPAVAGPPPKMV